MIKQYARDENKKPIGIVIYDNGYFGWSLCNQKDKWDKKLGLRIALNRLEKKLDQEKIISIKYIYNGNKENRIIKIFLIIKDIKNNIK